MIIKYRIDHPTILYATFLIYEVFKREKMQIVTNLPKRPISAVQCCPLGRLRSICKIRLLGDLTPLYDCHPQERAKHGYAIEVRKE